MIPGLPDVNGLNQSVSLLSRDLQDFFSELKRATNEIHEAATASMILKTSIDESNNIMKQLVVEMRKMAGDD